MGLEFYNSSSPAKAIFEKAEAICGPGLLKVIFEGPQELLTSTAYCQPAILTTSVALLKAFEAHEKYKQVSVKFTAGLSLGEYSALAASHVMSFPDLLRLVQKRASFMEEAARENEGGMAAVIGFDKDKLVEICQKTGAQVANFNSKEQIVITGLKPNVDKAIEAIKEAGGDRIIPLAVSGAFHSTLMASAARKFADVIKDVAINPASVPVLSNVHAGLHGDAKDIRINLAQQITGSVQWVKCVEYIASQGITDFIEIGPSKVLKGLIRKIDSSLNVYNIEKPQDIDAINC
ncbi:MAG: ACP S-malonyltransferase [Candidatus Omnitrophica bacterium]|nr:ACP S-malonyltransferase [Candidatus Omnitrophota bacterium]